MDKAGDFWLGPEKGMEFGAALGWVKRDEAPQVSPCLPADAEVGGAKEEPGMPGGLPLGEKSPRIFKHTGAQTFL